MAPRASSTMRPFDARGPGVARLVRARAPFVLGASAAALVVVALLLVTGAVASLVVPAAGELGFAFFTRSTWDPSRGDVGALPFVYGTLVTSVLALGLALPGGIGVALFLTDFGPSRLRRPVESTIQVLAAIPSVVYGLWGALALAPVLRDVAPVIESVLGFVPAFRGPSAGFGYLCAGLVLALMVIPTVATVSREVLSSVPAELREGGLALGATRWEVLKHVVLPHARRGLVGAVLLGFARAASETMAVAMVIGSRPEISPSLFAPGYTISSVIANEFAHASSRLHGAALAALGLALLAVTLVVNVCARLLVRGVRMGTERRREGAPS